MRPLLYDYFKKTATSLDAEYDKSAEQKASSNLGRNRESFCRLFLKKHLPPKLKIRSGEVWDSKGHKTGQLDTIIIRDDAPALEFGGDNTYLGEGVCAVVEIKSNLNKAKLRQAANNLISVQKLTIDIGTTSYFSDEEDSEPLFRPLRIAFGYEGATWKTITGELEQRNWQDVFDLICILNRGVLIKKGLLIKCKEQTEFEIIKGSAAAVGFMYYYLTHYANSFLGRSIKVSQYFEPLSEWGE